MTDSIIERQEGTRTKKSIAPGPAAGRSLAAGKKQPRLIEVKVRYTFGVYRAVIAPSEDDPLPWSRKNHKQHAPHDWVIVRWIDKPPMMCEETD